MLNFASSRFWSTLISLMSLTPPCSSLLIPDLNSDSYLDVFPGTPGLGGGNHQRTKRMRTSFKHHQLRTMKSYFAINHNPDAKDLKQLSQKTGLPKRVLQVILLLRHSFCNLLEWEEKTKLFSLFRFCVWFFRWHSCVIGHRFIWMVVCLATVSLFLRHLPLPTYFFFHFFINKFQ